MQQQLPIKPGVKDPHFRYMMPKMELCHGGRGNGVWTNIVNIDEVAKILEVPFEAIMKYFSNKLGCKLK